MESKKYATDLSDDEWGYFYPWSVVGWIRLAEEDEQEEEPRAAGSS